MIRIGICYTACRPKTQTVAPNLPGLQCVKCCIQYLASHLHKPISHPYNYYFVSNVNRLTYSGTQVEFYRTQNFQECHKDVDHVRIINIRRSVSGNIHTLLGVAVFCKVHIQLDVESDTTGEEIRYVYKAVNKTKAKYRYKEALSLHIGAPTVHW